MGFVLVSLMRTSYVVVKFGDTVNVETVALLIGVITLFATVYHRYENTPVPPDSDAESVTDWPLLIAGLDGVTVGVVNGG